MRILLVQARFSVHFGYVTPPLGLMSLSAFLKRAGYRDVEVLHLDALPASGEHLKGKLREFKPDIVGIGAMTAQAKSMHAAARLVKELLPEALVLVGGAHPTHYPEDCANDPAIDAAVLHEGELTLLELVRRHEKGEPLQETAGVVLRRDGRAVRTRAREFIEDLDSLPFPDYDAVDLEAYRNLMPCSILAYRQKYTSVMTSRGCPYHCTFCHRVMGKKFRAQSPERALSELTLLHERYGIDHIEMIDDIANCSPERFKAILRGLIARGLGLKIYLAAGLRADLLDEETIDLMPRAGVVALTVAVETGSPRMQKLIKKNLDLGKTRKIIDCAARRRIYVQGLFMLGFPGETAGDMFQTLRYAAGSRLHSMMIASCFGFRGTELGESLPEGAVMSPDTDVNVYEGYSFGRGAPLPAWRMKLMKLLINLTFYYNPFRIWRIIRDMPNRNLALAVVFLKKIARKTVVLR